MNDRASEIMLVAGEASGDLHGATLCRALRSLAPQCRLVGMGGARMAAAGMDVLIDVTAAAVVGGTESISRWPLLVRTFRSLRARVAGAPRPSALVLIDFPEFNLRLARAARRAGVPVVYFVPPQIWAWRPGRVAEMRRVVSLVLAVLPFEAPLYRQAGVPVEFVGHPVLDALETAPDRETARRRLGLDESTLVIGLVPGSRREEVARMLPLMREAAAHVVSQYPGARFLVALAPTIARQAIAAHTTGPPALEIVSDATYAVMRAADLLLVTSGTATLEAALLGTPMVVGYRLTPLSELIVSVLIRVPWMSLANLTLGWAAVPELSAKDLTSDGLAREALRLLADRDARDAQRRAFRELAARLGAPGVGVRAARHVLEVAGAA